MSLAADVFEGSTLKFAVLGASGVGKSTWIRAISGREPDAVGRTFFPVKTNAGTVQVQLFEAHEEDILNTAMSTCGRDAAIVLCDGSAPSREFAVGMTEQLSGNRVPAFLCRSKGDLGHARGDCALSVSAQDGWNVRAPLAMALRSVDDSLKIVAAEPACDVPACARDAARGWSACENCAWAAGLDLPPARAAPRSSNCAGVCHRPGTHAVCLLHAGEISGATRASCHISRHQDGGASAYICCKNWHNVRCARAVCREHARAVGLTTTVTQLDVARKRCAVALCARMGFVQACDGCVRRAASAPAAGTAEGAPAAGTAAAMGSDKQCESPGCRQPGADHPLCLLHWRISCGDRLALKIGGPAEGAACRAFSLDGQPCGEAAVARVCHYHRGVVNGATEGPSQCPAEFARERAARDLRFVAAEDAAAAKTPAAAEAPAPGAPAAETAAAAPEVAPALQLRCAAHDCDAAVGAADAVCQAHAEDFLWHYFRPGGKTHMRWLVQDAYPACGRDGCDQPTVMAICPRHAGYVEGIMAAETRERGRSLAERVCDVARVQQDVQKALADPRELFDLAWELAEGTYDRARRESVTQAIFGARPE